MANTTIKITQLQNIGNGLASNTLLPVVNTTGTAITQKVTVGNVANFIMGQAGNTLAPAFLANLAYSVVNAAQPNITSVGTLNVNTLKISGGTNGYVLQTNGSGNLSWVAQSGSGNGSPGGSNSQLQFNLGGSFAGDPELTWDAGNNQLNTVNFAASSATIYGNVNAINVNASGNIRPNAIYTDHYYYANGYVFGGGGGNGAPGGTDTQIQFNDNGVFGGNAGFTFDKVAGILSSPFLVGSGNGLSNIQGANISGAVATATYATNVAGANVSGEVTFAGTANSVAVANVVGIGNIATLSLDGSTSNVLYGNGVFAAITGGANTGNVTFSGNVISTTSTNDLLISLDNKDFIANTSNGGAMGFYSGNSSLVLNNDTPGVELTGLNVNIVAVAEGDIFLDATAANGVVQISSEANTTITANGNDWTFDNDGRLTFPGTPRIDTATNNFEVQAAEAINFEANTVVNIYTDTGNTTYQWQFGDDGVLTVPGNLVYIGASPAPSINGFDSANFAGNVTGANFIGNGNTLSNVATKTSGSWTLASGVNTVSISVPVNGTYAIWVNGNIPNGIVTYTATAVVTNTNVPVLGEQYGWFYELGNALVLTSIPNQFVGTQGAISNATPYLGNTSNVFTFGITNNSGSSQEVNWGYTKL